MKSITIDKDKCLGCGTCVALAPKVFKIGDDAKAQVISPAGDTDENIKIAIDSCPVGAIKGE